VATLIFYFAIFFLHMRQPLLTDSRAFVLLLFLLKCSYWVFSARQIRLGYPKGLTSGGPSQSANYFFRDFSFGGYCAYMVYLGAPFLSDMRCMLDWTCTPTTLDFFQWYTVWDPHHTYCVEPLSYLLSFTGHARRPLLISFSGITT
jgi:hypothetical protein